MADGCVHFDDQKGIKHAGQYGSVSHYARLVTCKVCKPRAFVEEIPLPQNAFMESANALMPDWMAGRYKLEMYSADKFWPYEVRVKPDISDDMAIRRVIRGKIGDHDYAALGASIDTSLLNAVRSIMHRMDGSHGYRVNAETWVDIRDDKLCIFHPVRR